MWVIRCLIVYNPFLFLYFLLWMMSWGFWFLYEVVLLAATSESLFAFLATFVGNLYGMTELFVVAVVAFIQDLAGDILGER